MSDETVTFGGDWQPGQSVGRKGWILVRIIGQGAMGEVWEAVNPLMPDTSVAIKRLLRGRGRTEAFKERLQAEAKALEGLKHEAIVGFRDIDEDADGESFLVLEFVQGDTLDELANGGAMPLDQVLAWCRPIAEALDHAHRRGGGIRHRDVKPSNIIIAQGTGQAMLLDFGIAVPRPSGRGHVQPAGTLAYMSPQALRGKDEAANDIYALAATLYHLLAGRAPFVGDDVEGQILDASPDRIPNLPKEANDAILAGLAKEIERRPETAVALIDRASGTLADPGLATGTDVRPSPPVRTSSATAPPSAQPPRRSRMLVGATATLLLGGGGAAGFYLLQDGGTPEATPLPPAPSPPAAFAALLPADYVVDSTTYAWDRRLLVSADVASAHQIPLVTEMAERLNDDAPAELNGWQIDASGVRWQPEVVRDDILGRLQGELGANDAEVTFADSEAGDGTESLGSGASLEPSEIVVSMPEQLLDDASFRDRVLTIVHEEAPSTRPERDAAGRTAVPIAIQRAWAILPPVGLTLHRSDTGGVSLEGAVLNQHVLDEVCRLLSESQDTVEIDRSQVRIGPDAIIPAVRSAYSRRGLTEVRIVPSPRNPTEEVLVEIDDPGRLADAEKIPPDFIPQLRQDPGAPPRNPWILVDVIRGDEPQPTPDGLRVPPTVEVSSVAVSGFVASPMALKELEVRAVPRGLLVDAKVDPASVASRLRTELDRRKAYAGRWLILVLADAETDDPTIRVLVRTGEGSEEVERWVRERLSASNFDTLRPADFDVRLAPALPAGVRWEAGSTTLTGVVFDREDRDAIASIAASLGVELDLTIDPRKVRELLDAALQRIEPAARIVDQKSAPVFQVEAASDKAFDAAAATIRSHFTSDRSVSIRRRVRLDGPGPRIGS